MVMVMEAVVLGTVLVVGIGAVLIWMMVHNR